MPFTINEKVELVLLRGDGHLTYNEVSDVFHERHPNRPKPTASAIQKFIQLFKTTGSVIKQKHRSCAWSEAEEINVVAAFSHCSRTSIRTVAANSGISTWIVHKILKKNNLRPFKPTKVHKLFPQDFGPRIDFALWIFNKVGDDPNFVRRLMITDECIFHTNGMVSNQVSRMWATENPHWIKENNNQYRQSVMVWCGIYNRQIIGPYFFEETINGQVYLRFLKTYLYNNVLEDMPLEERRNLYFQQDGAPPHYAVSVRNWLNQNFNNRWIGRGGPVTWPPRSPDFSACDFFLWGYLKQTVFRTPVENVNKLRTRIIAACAKINNETLKRVETEFLRRLQYCIINDGKHVEGKKKI